jgi:MFS family permease
VAGVISGAMLPLRRAWNLSEWEQQIVVSSTVLAACLGSLVMGSRLNESLGRCGAIQWAAIAFTVGSILLLVAFNFTSLVVGRVVVGLGIGIAHHAIVHCRSGGSTPTRRIGHGQCLHGVRTRISMLCCMFVREQKPTDISNSCPVICL